MRSGNPKVNVLEGSITRNLLVLAWPVVAGMLLHTSFNIVDTYFVGKINPFALAGIGLSFPVMFVIFALAGGLSVGGSALVAQKIGAKKFEDADNVAEHLLLLAFIVSIVLAGFGLYFTEEIFASIGADEHTLPYVLDYIRIIFLAMPFITFSFAGSAIMQAEGDTKTPMKIMAFVVGLNVILDPLLIFGLGPFPELGIKGAALATAIARGLSVFLIFGHFALRRSLVTLSIRCFRFNLKIIKDILFIGVPASLMQVSIALWLLVMNVLVAAFGPYAVAAFGVGLRIDSFGILLAHGLAAAVLTIVGQNVGAGNFERAEKTVWRALAIAFVTMHIIGAFFMYYSTEIIAVFNQHPDVVSIGGSYLWIMGLVYSFPAILITTSSAFQGAGDSRPGLALTLTRVVVIAIPGAIFLARTYGIDGIWYAMAGSGFFTAVGAVIWFRFFIRRKARNTSH